MCAIVFISLVISAIYFGVAGIQILTISRMTRHNVFVCKIKYQCQILTPDIIQINVQMRQTYPEYVTWSCWKHTCPTPIWVWHGCHGNRSHSMIILQNLMAEVGSRQMWVYLQRCFWVWATNTVIRKLSNNIARWMLWSIARTWSH